MNNCITSNFSEIVSLVFAGLALTVSAFSYLFFRKISRKQYEINLKQFQMSMFTEYTRRYQEIKFKLIQEKENLSPYYEMYTNLCGEEYYMHINNCLPSDVWDMWVAGMKCIMNCEEYKTEWKRIANEYNDDFVQFIDKQILTI